MEWLKSPDDKRPEFIMLYFDEPDHTGHVPGPDTDDVCCVTFEIKLFIVTV